MESGSTTALPAAGDRPAAGEAGSPRPPGAPSHYLLLTPNDWFRIPLRDRSQRERSVRALVDLTSPRSDDRAAQRRELRALLTTVVEDASARDGIELYLATDAVMGLPVPASLLISTEPGDPATSMRLPVPMMADALRDRRGPDADISLVDLPAGQAVRCRRQESSPDTQELGQPANRPSTLLDFYLPIPDAAGWLLLTFSTPIPELADPLTILFDAIAGSLRWSRTQGDARA